MTPCFSCGGSQNTSFFLFPLKGEASDQYPGRSFLPPIPLPPYTLTPVPEGLGDLKVLVLEYKAVVKKSQSTAINEAIRTSQFVRNKVLRYWMDNRGVGKKELYQYNTALRAEYKFVKDLNSHACQASVENVERAIKRFFDNCKNKKPGKKTPHASSRETRPTQWLGYPRFKKDSRSVEYKTSGWKLHPSKRRITFSDKKGIGELKLLGKWDIHTYPIELIKRVRIVRRADGYYVQFCVKAESTTEPRTGDGEIGLDVGLEFFYSDSNGHHEENPQFLRKAEKAIKHAQRRIYTKEKGKNNRRKARGRYARKHLRVSRQREEHAKKVARNVCKANAYVAYEDLNVKGLSTRTHACKCGCVLQRDVNAAVNILFKAKSTGGHPGSNAWGVETATLLGATLVEQVTTLSQESPCL